MVFRNPNSNIMDLEIQFIDSDSGEEKINGRLVKIGNFNNSNKFFEGSSFKNLEGQKFEIGKPKFNLFSNTFFDKIYKLNSTTDAIYKEKLKYKFIIGQKDLFLIDAQKIKLKTSAILNSVLILSKRAYLAKNKSFQK